jgi:hypothetical protein
MHAIILKQSRVCISKIINIKNVQFLFLYFALKLKKKQQLQCGLIQCLIETSNLSKFRTLVVF